jgi:O-antigen/teichoic acid export membrane protein
MEYPTAIGLYLTDRTKWFTPIYLVALAVNLVMNYIFVPTYGMLGAGWAWLVAWVVIAGGMAVVGQRYYPLDYNWRMILLPLVPWLGVLVAQTQFVSWLPQVHWAARVALSLAVIAGAGIWLVRDLHLSRSDVVMEGASA